MSEWGDEWGEEWGGAIAQIQTHEADAVDRLKFHLSGKANAESVVQIFAERWQIIDNFLSDLLTLIDLDNSFGDLQDKIGKILNVDRAGFLDEDYRRFLNAKALVLIRKRKTVPGLLELARALLGPKMLSSLEPFVFHPDMSTLIDRISASIGAATGTTYVADNDARNFEEVNGDFVTYATSPHDLSGEPFSFATRITTESTDNDGYLIEIRGAGSSLALAFRLDTARRLRFQVGYDTTDLQIRTVTLPIAVIGSEIHVAVTWDGGDIATDVHIYVDGIEQAYNLTTDGVGTQDPRDENWTFGNRLSAGAGFDGSIRDLRAWNRVLTGAEIITLFQGGKRFIGYKETYPKAYQLTLEGITTEEEIVFREFLRVARPATYNGTVLVVPDPAFGYDDSTAVFPTDVEGFDDATATVVAGGPYAHLLVL